MNAFDALAPKPVSRRQVLTSAAATAALAVGRMPGITSATAQDASPAATAPIMTASGPVTGVVLDGIEIYKGIPYVAAPMGELRWRHPQPAAPWTEPLAAVDFCSDCMQAPGPEGIQTTPSEDCLGLNVWRPSWDVTIDAPLPVLIWIHGGGYIGGGSSIPWFDGAAFARQGMIFVSFNYRLGRFGFFAPSALIENTDAPYANYGYLDQIAALHWVQENIGAFGGDPTRVTLMGESAGGASVIHLLTSPAVEDGLFHQAVILSGGGREALLDRPFQSGSLTDLSAPAVDNFFSASIGVIGGRAHDLDRLRALPAETLVADLDLEKLAKRTLTGGPLVGVPATDGIIVEGQPQDHFLHGTARLMPVIIGTTAVDVPTHFPPSKLHPLSWFGPDEDAAREAYGYGAKRFLGPGDLIQLRLAIGADLTMHEPAHFIASTMQEAGFGAWVYRFTYTAESTRPASMAQVHSGELPFLFDNLAARYGDAVTDNDEAAAIAFHTYVSNFVKNGNPNGDGLPDWP
ncbi:MAG TPA: carboxylesterase family protein, partial [Thermomicrobiales bacterium]|nr:carboxylesterase family protein [Thermomicrobiales bacterium]